MKLHASVFTRIIAQFIIISYYNATQRKPSHVRGTRGRIQVKKGEKASA